MSSATGQLRGRLAGWHDMTVKDLLMHALRNGIPPASLPHSDSCLTVDVLGVQLVAIAHGAPCYNPLQVAGAGLFWKRPADPTLRLKGRAQPLPRLPSAWCVTACVIRQYAVFQRGWESES